MKKKKVWEKRIPTILAFVILLGSIILTLQIIKSRVLFVGRATPDTTPQNIKITNITDASFAVTFTTAAKTVGGASIDSGEEGATLAMDDKNKSGGEQKQLFSHHITVGDLKQKTQYNFQIISEGESYSDSGKKFTVTTAPVINTPPTAQNPIFGKVLLPGGEAASDTLIIATAEDMQTLSAVTKDSGEFTIPVNSARNLPLESYKIFSDQTPITITARRENMKSTITLLYKDAQNIPSITLSFDYDFKTTNQEPEEATPTSSLKIPTLAVKQGEVKIITPKKDERFTDQQPRFQGAALPNQKVKITIHSDENIVTEVKSDNNGIWTYRPPKDLSPGEHTIIIETVDGFGVIRRITQTFAVFASGSQISLDATGSPTQMPTPTPTNATTPSPTLTGTPTISPAVSPTPTTTPASPSPTTVVSSPTPVVSATVAPTQIPPTPKPTITSPGGTHQTIILSVISALFILTGTTLLFLL